MDFSLGVPSVRASMHASESWHSGTNAPYQGSGTNATPPEPMHQDANRFFSGKAWRPAPPIHFPKTRGDEASDPCPPHLRKAPPRGRGSGPLPQRPLQLLLRCPPTRQSCTARRVPSDGRGGSAREPLGQASFPAPPPTRESAGASARMRSRGRQRLLRGRSDGGGGGCARQASW